MTELQVMIVWILNGRMSDQVEKMKNYFPECKVNERMNMDKWLGYEVRVNQNKIDWWMNEWIKAGK